MVQKDSVKRVRTDGTAEQFERTKMIYWQPTEVNQSLQKERDDLKKLLEMTRQNVLSTDGKMQACHYASPASPAWVPKIKCAFQ